MYRIESELSSRIQLIHHDIENLICHEQYKSADILISLFLSQVYGNITTTSLLSSVKTHTTDSIYAKLCELQEKQSDCIYEQGEYKRALESYSKTLMKYKQLFSNLSQSYGSTVYLYDGINNNVEAGLKFKECKCLIQLKDLTTALKEFELIPSTFYTPIMKIQLANLYKTLNMKKQAISYYKDILKTSPTCIEALESWISICDVPISSSEIIHYMQDCYRGLDQEELFASGWLQEYIHSLVYKRNGEYEKLEQKFSKLHKLFPNNIHLLGIQGATAVDCERFDEAYIVYKKLRRIDPNCVENMDKFALMLFEKGDVTELNVLSQSILNNSTMSRPAPWLVIALLCELKQNSKAMTFIDKALAIDYKYPMSYILKGKLLLSHGDAKQAAVAFYQSQILSKDLLSLNGLVDACLELNRFNEAVTNAKEALQLMPKCSISFWIMGKVLSKNKSTLSDSLKAFDKVLKLHPTNQKVACFMADVYQQLNRVPEAVSLLREFISRNCGGYHLRLHLAKLIAIQGNYEEAITELHHAGTITIDPSFVNQEIERIEALMRGENTARHLEEEEEEEEQDEEEESYPAEEMASEYDTYDAPTTYRSGRSTGTSLLHRNHSPSPRMLSMHSNDFDSEEDETRLTGVDRELFSD